MPSSTVENYIKRIYFAQQEHRDSLVLMGTLAGAMGVVPGTATAMVKTLADAGLVSYEPREGVRLTTPGQRLALHVIRRHRLIELFLVRTLGLDWAQVHAEAELLEHYVSDVVLERIDQVLGHPTTDPHGDPIPSATGHMEQDALPSLAEIDPGREVQVVRVLDQEPAFLHFVQAHRLTPGATVTVLACDSAADAVTLRTPATAQLTLGRVAARKILAQPGTPADGPMSRAGGIYDFPSVG